MTIANGSVASATDVLKSLDANGYADFNASTVLTIASGVITRVQSFHRIETEGGAASDDLDTINGGAEGAVLFIRAATAAHVVTIKHNTGNIVNSHAADFRLAATNDLAILIYDVNLAKWICSTSGYQLPTSVNPFGNRTAANEFIQRGTVAATNAGVAVTFGVTFTTVIGAWLTASGTGSLGTSVASLATTGFTAYVASAGAVTCYWLAIGT